MLKKKSYVGLVSFVLVFVFIMSTEARAATYGSWAVVENNSGMPGTVASQLSVDVDPGTGSHSGEVLFTFSNEGSHLFYISDIYFDDGAVLGIASIDDTITTGVDFTQPAQAGGGDLPGGGNVLPPFVTSSNDDKIPHFSAMNEPGAAWGVDPGEKVGIYFEIDTTFANVIQALNVGFDPATYYYTNNGTGDYEGWDLPSLRIGVHVQSIDGPWGNDKSDTYILTPVPGAVLLGILGLGVAGLKLRKFA